MEPGKVGFKINEFKTKEMRVKASTNLVLTTNSRDVEQMKYFTYPGSIVTKMVEHQRMSTVISRRRMGPSCHCTQFGRIYILEPKFSCGKQMFSQSYCMGVERGK